MWSTFDVTYKIGDKVRILPLHEINHINDLDNECPNGIFFNMSEEIDDGMDICCGKVYEITNIHTHSVELTGDAAHWIWSYYWIKPAVEYKVKLDEDLFTV